MNHHEGRSIIRDSLDLLVGITKRTRVLHLRTANLIRSNDCLSAIRAKVGLGVEENDVDHAIIIAAGLAVTKFLLKQPHEYQKFRFTSCT